MLPTDLDTHAAALERADCGGYVQTHNDASLLRDAAAEMRASADALDAAHTELAALRRRYIAEVKAGNAARRLALALAGHLRRRTAERDAAQEYAARLDAECDALARLADDIRWRVTPDVRVAIDAVIGARPQARLACGHPVACQDGSACRWCEETATLRLNIAKLDKRAATIDEAMGSTAPTLPMGVARAATGWGETEYFRTEEGSTDATPR